MPVKDVKIYTGAAEGWVSIGDLSKASLPISSDDGTVVLDSPSANTFTVSTGGAERVTVDGQGKVEIGTGSTSTASEFTVNGVSNARFRRNARSADLVDFQDGDCQELRIINNANGGKDSGVSMSHWSWAVGNTIDQRTQRNQIRFWDEAVSFQTGDGTTNVEVTNDGDLIVRNQVRTSTVKGLVDTDASIFLDNVFKISHNNTPSVEVDNQGRIKLLRNSVVSDSAFESYMQFNVTGGGEAYKDNNIMFVAGSPRLAINSDGSVRLVANSKLKGAADDSAELSFPTSRQIQTNADYTPTQPNSIATKQYVDDQAGGNLPIQSDDGTVVLDSPSADTFTVSTGGAERVTVNNSGLTVISSNGANNTSLESGNSVSVVDCDLSNTVANSAFGIRVDGTYRFYMTSNGNVGIGDTLTVPSQKLAVDGSVGAASYVQYKSSSCGMFFPETTKIEIHPGSNLVSFISSTTKTTVKGPVGTDAQIDLGANLTVSTNGVERVKVKPASYGSGAVTVGPDHTHSIGGVSVKNDPAQVAYSSQMQMRFVDENGKYAYTGCTEPRFAVGGGYALLDGGAFFAGHDNGHTVIFSGTKDVIVATGGMANNQERLRVSNTEATFNVPVRTSTVKGVADTDASIDLGANIVVNGKIQGTGNYTPQIELAAGYTVNVTQSRYYNRYAGDSAITHLENIFNASGESVSSTIIYGPSYSSALPLDCPVGSEPFTLSSKDDLVYQSSRVLFCSSATNSIADFEFNLSDPSNPAFIVNKGLIQTSTVKGLVDTDAQINLGAELLTTNHTPTQPNSLITKSYLESYISSPGGNGGGVSTPGNGADFRYRTVSVSVQSQRYGPIISYDGVFNINGRYWSTDGENWTDQGYDFDKGVQPLNGSPVIKGNGQYLCARHFSNDMKRWTECLDPATTRAGLAGNAFLNGVFYSLGFRNYYQDGDGWKDTQNLPQYVPGGNSAGYLASQESGNFCVMVNENIHNYNGQKWDPGDVYYWKINNNRPEHTQIPGISGAKCVRFSERLQRFVILGADSYWVVKPDPSQGIESTGSLPVTGDWKMLCDDGYTLTATQHGNLAMLYSDSETGVSWKVTTELGDDETSWLTGTNGRTIASAYSHEFSDVYSYQISGYVTQGASTRDIELTHPASIASARAIDVNTQEIVTGNPTHPFRVVSVGDKQLDDQNQTNEFLLQEISRLQKLIEEKCDS